MFRNVLRMFLALMMITLMLGCDLIGGFLSFEFDANGGTSVTGFKIPKEDWDGSLPGSTRTGFAFGGWFLEPELTTLATKETVIGPDVFLYARWVPANTEVRVEYWLEDINGIYLLEETETFGGVVGQAVFPNPKEYEGFALDRNHPDAVFQGVPNFTSTLVLKLYYLRESYQITFAYGLGLPNITMTYKAGEPIVIPSDEILHESYLFEGWYYTSNSKEYPYNLVVMPPTDIRFYAFWNPKTVTVTFETNEGSAIAPISGKVFTSMRVPFTSREGYHFFGWYTDPDFQNRYLEMTSFPARNLTLYAKWIGIDITITVNHWVEKDDGTYQLIETTYEEGTIGRFHFAMIREYPGYVYTNTHPDQLLTGWPQIGSPLNLHVYYERTSFELTIVSTCGDEVPVMLVKRNTILTEVMPTLECTGYIFRGYYIDQTYNFQIGRTMPAAAFTVYAKWLPKEIHFVFETDHGNPLETLVYLYLSPYELPNAVSVGYNFSGWYLDQALTIPFPVTGTTPIEDVTLYAKWDPALVTVTFVTNGALAIEPIVVPYLSSYALPSPEQEGYIFGGWYIDQDLTIQHVNTGAMTPIDFTLYAKWYGQTYYIHFDTMGGSYLPGMSLASGTTLELPTPTRPNFIFLGWYDATLTVPFTGTVMPDNNLQLYAKWQLQ
jgi:uncharacterized repeat protein (TIGR02543 family)